MIIILNFLILISEYFFFYKIIKKQFFLLKNYMKLKIKFFLTKIEFSPLTPTFKKITLNNFFEKIIEKSEKNYEFNNLLNSEFHSELVENNENYKLYQIQS